MATVIKEELRFVEETGSNGFLEEDLNDQYFLLKSDPLACDDFIASEHEQKPCVVKALANGFEEEAKSEMKYSEKAIAETGVTGVSIVNVEASEPAVEMDHGNIDYRQKKHRIKKRYKCVVCRVRLSDWSKLQEHLATNHREIFPHECLYCKQRFRRKHHMQTHVTVHDHQRYQGEPQFACDRCDRKYHVKISLWSHKRIKHSGCGDKVKPRTDAVVGCRSIGVPASPDLVRQMLCYNGDDNFSCEICKESMKSRQSLCLHLKTAHGPEANIAGARPNSMAGKPCVCPFCPKSFSIPSELLQHLLSHGEGRLHKCKFCDLCFKTTQALRTHEWGHPQKYNLLL